VRARHTRQREVVATLNRKNYKYNSESQHFRLTFRLDVDLVALPYTVPLVEILT
jgi:hypothetical protein